MGQVILGTFWIQKNSIISLLYNRYTVSPRIAWIQIVGFHYRAINFLVPKYSMLARFLEIAQILTHILVYIQIAICIFWTKMYAIQGLTVYIAIFYSSDIRQISSEIFCNEIKNKIWLWIVRWNVTNIWCLSDVYLMSRRYRPLMWRKSGFLFSISYRITILPDDNNFKTKKTKKINNLLFLTSNR